MPHPPPMVAGAMKLIHYAAIWWFEQHYIDVNPSEFQSRAMLSHCLISPKSIAWMFCGRINSTWLEKIREMALRFVSIGTWTGIVLLKTHKCSNLTYVVFTKSCLLSMSWKATFLAIPFNLGICLYFSGFTGPHQHMRNLISADISHCKHVGEMPRHWNA